MKPVPIAAALLLVVMGMYGCGETISLRFCDPGETKTCTCYSGEAGQMICQSNGLAWSICECEADGDLCDSQSGDSFDENQDNMDGDGYASAACGRDMPCTDPNTYCYYDRLAEEGRCLLRCTLGDSCPDPYICDETNGQCMLPAGMCLHSEDCTKEMPICSREPGHLYGRCIAPCYVAGDDCSPGAVCCLEHDYRSVCSRRGGWCINMDVPPVCLNKSDCPERMYCEVLAGRITGHCREYCNDDSNCPEGLVCREDRRCGVGMQEGDCGGTCPPGSICDPLFNQCLPDCLDCGPLDYCDIFGPPNCIPGGCRVNPTVCGLLLPPCCIGYTCTTTVYGELGHCI